MQGWTDSHPALLSYVCRMWREVNLSKQLAVSAKLVKANISTREAVLESLEGLMSKVAVVFWSQSGNTQAMAEAVAEGAGTEAIEVSSFSAADVAYYDAFAFGCPAMGAEELESDEFEPVWDACVPEFGSKPVALFGSYGWGDGEWMEIWKSAAEDAGVKVVSTVICNDAPDDDALSQLKDLGEELAQ